MRILHVYRTYFPDTQGGLEEAVRQICVNTQTHGVENRIFCLSHNPAPEIVHLPEADVYRAPLTFEIASCGFSLSGLTLFKQLTEWADIVHYQFPWPFADLLHFLARVKKPTLITYQSDIVRQKLLMKFYAPLMKRFLASTDYLVATSPNYVETSPVLVNYKNKLKIIPIGLNRGSYPVATAAMVDSARRQYGNNFFLFIGVLRYYKGLRILLHAMRNAPYRVVIAGKGPIEAELKWQAETMGLDNVIFAGFVDDETKVALLQATRGVVFPSHLRAEAFGVTLLEGAMFAKPLITTEIGSGMSYINRHQVTGLVIPPNDAAALRGAMDILYNQPSTAEQMGMQALQRYQELFTGAAMGASYSTLYKQISRE